MLSGVDMAIFDVHWVCDDCSNVTKALTDWVPAFCSNIVLCAVIDNTATYKVKLT